MSAVLKEVQAPTDPLVQFLAADVPLRTLLEQGADRLDWLAALETSPIVMTHPDGRGGMLVEEVTKIQLIERGFALGFEADEAGECDIFCWKTHCVWEDAKDAANRVPGIWFVHQDVIDDESGGPGGFGTPMTIPPDRYAELRSDWAEYVVQAQEKRRIVAEMAELYVLAKRFDGLLEGRIAGRMKRDGVALSFTEAFAEVEAISVAHEVDPVSDDTAWPPMPWTSEQRHVIAKAMRFVNDVVTGKPVSECTALAFLPDDEE